jgi:RNA recognition motif-containing protein
VLLFRRSVSDDVQSNESEQLNDSATGENEIPSTPNASSAPTPLETKRHDESIQEQPSELVGREGDATEFASNANLQVPRNPNYFQPPPNNAIYVGNLLFDIRSQDLEATFSKYGQLKSAQISYDSRGLSRG